jgi:threonine/homoserine/homoserine lactone efflux protein
MRCSPRSGVSALIASSPAAFKAMRWSGVAYLLYLGTKALRSRDRFSLAAGRERTPAATAFWQGTLTSALNPKGIVFFLSILPQFVDSGSGSLAVLGLALVMPAICLVVYSGWAVLAGAVGERLGQNPRLGDILRWVSGVALIALGAKLALDRR